MKIYAVKNVDGQAVHETYTTWDECKKRTNHHQADFKLCKSQEELDEFFGKKKEPIVAKTIINSSLKSIEYYIDGSFIDDSIGWSFVLVINNNVVTKMADNIPVDSNSSNNVTGELKAAINAIKHAYVNGYKEITIVYDYEGIEKIPTGIWKKLSSRATIEYRDFYNKIKDNLIIHFKKVRGHSGDKYNTLADETAKIGATIWI